MRISQMQFPAYLIELVGDQFGVRSSCPEKPQLAPNGLGNVEQNSAEFCEREQTEPLPIVHRYHFQGGREELLSAFPNAASEWLPLAQDKMGLHQGVSQQNHQRLIDH